MLNMLGKTLHLVRSLGWHFDPIRATSLILKLYAKKTNVTRRDIQIFFVQYCYFWGTVPFHYDDKTDLFVLPERARRLFCTRLILTLHLIPILALTLNSVNTVLRKGLVVTNLGHIFIYFYTVCCTCAGIAHLQIHYKRREVVELLNSYQRHIKYLHGKHKELMYIPLIYLVSQSYTQCVFFN